MDKRKRTEQSKQEEIDQNSFITHTFSDCVENHDGMQMHGTKRVVGLSESSLCESAVKFPEMAIVYRFEMNDQKAVVVVFRGGVDYLLGNGGADDLFLESKAQQFDTQFFNVRRKVVQNKHGRLNNCYADMSQDADIPQRKGTVIAFDSAPKMKELRAKIPTLLGTETERLYAETNYYKDVRRREVGIGFHGDGERSIVVGVRLGEASLPIRFQWYHKSKPISEEIPIELHHGDVYAFSHTAVGGDWMCPSKTTLRHGVGRKAVTRAIGA